MSRIEMGEIRKYVTLIGPKKRLRVKALFDTGATTSIIRKSIADEIGLRPYGKKISGESVDGTVVSGDKVLLEIMFEKGRMPLRAIVVPSLTDKVIIGVDFMQQMDLKINFKTEKVKVPIIYKRRRFRI